MVGERVVFIRHDFRVSITITPKKNYDYDIVNFRCDFIYLYNILLYIASNVIRKP